MRRRRTDRQLLAHPHHLLIVKAARKFGFDPQFQLRLHLIATGVWAVNFVAATLLFFLAQGTWNHFATYYLVCISLYANFATDYGAVPGAIAAVHAKALDIGTTTSSNGGEW